MSFVSQIIPSDAWSIPIGRSFAKEDYPDISFRVPWEQLQMTRDGARQGCPIGGMGAGSIGRSYFGDFARWQIIPYEHIYDNEVYGSQFHLYVRPEGSDKTFIQTLMAGSPGDSDRPSLSGTLSRWPWNYPVGQGSYSALFPMVWNDYSGHPENPIHIVLEQFSPVIPHNYYSTSLPLGIYNWHMHNPLKVPVEVGILFTFENMVGRVPEERNRTRDIGEFSECRWSESLPEIRQAHEVIEEEGFLGIRLSCHEDDMSKLPVSRRGEFAIAAGRGSSESDFSYLASFDCRGDGGETDGFFERGRLFGGPRHLQGSSGRLYGAAVCSTLTLQPDESGEVPMTLSWDFPEIKVCEPGGRTLKRKYTEYKESTEINALQFVRAGMQHRADWSEQIKDWHDEVRKSADDNPLLIRTILNEQYYLLDGGTLWEAETDNFGFLESIDYFNYETLDVRFYYSFTTLRYWPALENRVMELFKEGVSKEDRRIVPWKYGYDYGYQRPEDIKEDFRLVRGASPHDLGRPTLRPVTDPENAEDPFVHLNAYSYRNVNLWKDLNTKYVLMVYRNYCLSPARERKLLRSHWSSVVEAMEYLQQFDTNGDFIPENSGFPDQTFDSAWHMKGLSAYCGGLWLAALEAVIEMGRILGEDSIVKKYQYWLEVGKVSFHKTLWNGEYYDCYEGCSDVMADQLCGQWYADLLDLPPIDEPEYIIKAYKSIFRYNCLNYFNGKRGVVTGITTEGVIPDEEQTPEVWIAVNYSLASAFMMRGLRDEAMQIIGGTHSLIWEEAGLWWTTPEAVSCEEITGDRAERAYSFIREKRGVGWLPPEGYRMEELTGREILQMRAPQYSRPMASSVLLYVLDK
ncbi:GH116 family glycosyl hydrolase [Thermodesulfobacteriota bacterium]